MTAPADWLTSADNFFALGNFRAMRNCARELLALDPESADGRALLAQSSVYLGDLETAATALATCDGFDGNERLTLARAELAAAQLRLLDAVDLLTPALSILHRPLSIVSERAARLLVDVLVWLARPAPAAELCHRLALAFPAADPRRRTLCSQALWLANYRPPAPPDWQRDFARSMPSASTCPLPVVHGPSQNHRPAILYMSPDFREHAVANFLAPLLSSYNRDAFDVHACFSGTADAVTAKFRALLPAGHWHDGDCDIDSLRPDIVVDLAGHSQGTALVGALASRHAAVQISMIGDVATTAAPNVDALLVDDACAPGPAAVAEQLARVPHALCYDPKPVHKFPAVRHNDDDNAPVAFASFNNFNKVTDEMLALWARILDAVPRSTLTIRCKTASFGDGRAEIRRRCEAAHLDLHCLDLQPYSRDYLAGYNAVDIALDTWPYSGGATTCEALYMGVPVIALAAEAPLLRYSASVLAAAELPELLAASPDDYLRLAVNLAHDRPLLQRCHRTLRERLRRSPLMDARRYMADLEELFRQLLASRPQGTSS